MPSVYLFGKNGEAPNDSMMYKNLNIHYYKKLQVRPNMLYRWLNYQQSLCGMHRCGLPIALVFTVSIDRSRCRRNLASWGIFSYLDLQYAPKDTTAVCDTLNVTMQATFAKPLDAELELNVVTKVTTKPVPGHHSASPGTMYSEVARAGT